MYLILSNLKLQDLLEIVFSIVKLQQAKLIKRAIYKTLFKDFIDQKRKQIKRKRQVLMKV